MQKSGEVWGSSSQQTKTERDPEQSTQPMELAGITQWCSSQTHNGARGKKWGFPWLCLPPDQCPPSCCVGQDNGETYREVHRWILTPLSTSWSLRAGTCSTSAYANAFTYTLRRHLELVSLSLYFTTLWKKCYEIISLKKEQLSMKKSYKTGGGGGGCMSNVIASI